MEEKEFNVFFLFTSWINEGEKKIIIPKIREFFYPCGQMEGKRNNNEGGQKLRDEGGKKIERKE